MTVNENTPAPPVQAGSISAHESDHGHDGAVPQRTRMFSGKVECSIPLEDMLDSAKRKGSMFDLCECGLSNSECSWNKLQARRPDGDRAPWPFAGVLP